MWLDIMTNKWIVITKWWRIGKVRKSDHPKNWWTFKNLCSHLDYKHIDLSLTQHEPQLILVKFYLQQQIKSILSFKEWEPLLEPKRQCPWLWHDHHHTRPNEGSIFLAPKKIPSQSCRFCKSWIWEIFP